MVNGLRQELFQDQPINKNMVMLMLLSLDGKVLEQHKYFLSIERRCAVSTPEAVDDFLQKCPYEGMQQDEEFLSGKLRAGIVAGYLSRDVIEPLIFNVKQRGEMTAQKIWESDDAWYERLARNPHSFVSPERVSRLEGELIRFGAQIYQKDSRDVKVTPELIDTYCQKHNILLLKDGMIKSSGF